MPHFTPAALTFLRSLARHNDRAWFEANKPVYERELKAPMLALIEAITQTLPPAFARPPHRIMMRIYRDIRFSKDKRPYKTNVAAWWACEGLEKTSGGGFYCELTPDHVMIAAGVYMPAAPQLLAIRRHLLDHHQDYRKIVAGKKLRAVLTPFEGNLLTRPPKGFPADHPAGDLFRHRQWGVSATLPADRAIAPSLLGDITSRFRLATPLVDLLNAPLRPTPPLPLF